MLVTVLERGQQLGIYSGKPGQVLGVYPVGFVLVLVDQANLTSVGYQHLVPALFQKPALTQGEWVPTSMAMRIGSQPSKRCPRASGVVRKRPSSSTWPVSVS